MTRKLVLGLGVAIAFAMVGATATTASATGYGYGQGYGHGVHCMKYGETLWGVAYRYGVSANALAAHNGIHNPNYVRAGTCLHIPARGSGYGTGYGHDYGKDYGKGYGHDYGKGYGQGYGHDYGKGYNAGYGSGYGKKMGNRYCVRYGDTLYSIARYYGTSAWAIAHANGIHNPNYIRAGSCLIIPGY